MKQLKYQITFLSDWLCGSGLSSGSNADIIPVLDAVTGLPIVPGKTLKGLIREQLDMIQRLRGHSIEPNRIMGIEMDGNAEMSEYIKADLRPYLYRDLASVQINKRGLAVDHSLRVKKVVIPISLQGVLSYDEEKYTVDEIARLLKLIKCIGEGRNKGFGRCNIIVLND